MSAPEIRGQVQARSVALSTAWIAPPEAVATLVVAHGAGIGMDHPFLGGFCRALADEAIATLRFNFPYVERGRRAPDPEPVLREAWAAAFEEGHRRAGGLPVAAGAKSLGGRIASMCVADGMPAAALVFLGYPLHPPGKPERVRDAHLARVRVPMLFLQGTRDPFARTDVLEPVLGRLGVLAEYRPVEGGDHSFRVPGGRQEDREIGASLAAPAGAFLRRVVGGV